jgi:hypothetical protein
MPDDELTFALPDGTVLRASDPLAAGLVAAWADRAHKAGYPDDVVANAAITSEAMLTWRRRNPS